MRKLCFVFIIAVISFSACKKEEPVEPHNNQVTTHYAYLRCVVMDSATGLPIPHANVYYSGGVAIKGDIYSANNIADANGVYVEKITWYEGELNYYNTGSNAWLTTQPAGDADLYICAYTSTLCKSLHFKGAVLVENDTAILPVIYAKPYGFIKAHIKDIPSITDDGVYTHWDYTIGSEMVFYGQNMDTSVFREACPDVRTRFDASISSGSGFETALFYDSVVVRSGDTAYVDVFY